MKKTAVFIAALMLAPVAAHAGPNDLTIDYSDLDLSQKSDIGKLEKRIAKAADRHCAADVPVTGSRVIPSANRECARQFKKAAMEQFAAIVERERKGG